MWSSSTIAMSAMECEVLLVLRGGEEWQSTPSPAIPLCYAMAIPCPEELGLVQEKRDGTKFYRRHGVWGGSPKLKAIREDLLWLPGTVEMWLFYLEGRPIDEEPGLSAFKWKRVWQRTRDRRTSTIAFRVTSVEEFLRLESTYFGLMPHATRLFAFNRTTRAAFDGFQLTEKAQRCLWSSCIDLMHPELIGLTAKTSHWHYTVVRDDGPFITGDPVFCFRSEMSIVFEDHFAKVAQRHRVRLEVGELTKMEIKYLTQMRKSEVEKA